MCWVFVSRYWREVAFGMRGPRLGMIHRGEIDRRLLWEAREVGNGRHSELFGM